MKIIENNLQINELKVPVSLGITKDERSVKQEIKVSISISLSQTPIGCINDNIESTICYDNLCMKIKKICTEKPYNLIEHLCHTLLDKISLEINNKKDNYKAKIKVSVIKKTSDR